MARLIRLPMRKLVSLAACVMLLNGCASNSRNTMMITDDTALITVLGQGMENRETIFNEAIAEAALATRAHGYRYFVIIDMADATQTGVKVRRGRPIEIDNYPGFERGGSPLSSNYIGGANYSTPDQRTPYIRLGLDITIRMYRESDIDPATPGVWNSDIARYGE